MQGCTTRTIGCDLGDRRSHICVLSVSGTVQKRCTASTTRSGMTKFFEGLGQIVPLKTIAGAAKSVGKAVKFNEPTHYAGEVTGQEEADRASVLVAEAKKAHPDHPLDYGEALTLAREEMETGSQV